MPFEKLTTAPTVGDFTPLADHQSQTPGTFFGAKPVLHLHSADTQLVVSQPDLEGQSIFPDLRAISTPSTNGTTTNGDSADTQLAVSGLDVWVTSQNLLIFSPTISSGISLSYPDITLHAIQRLALPGATASSQTQGLYMQLALNASDHTPDEDLQTLEITLVPSSTPIADLFAAVSACADLNPDPADSDSEANEDDNGGIQIEGAMGGLPSAGGWITSDNIHEHVDADGNFTGFGGGALGAGAGTVRAREEDADFEDAGEEGGVDGEGPATVAGGGSSEETKWRRTE